MERLFVLLLLLPVASFAKVTNLDELIAQSSLEQAETAQKMKLPPIRTPEPVKVTKLARNDSRASAGLIRLVKTSSRFN
jgi:hypothetical protein